MANGMWSGQQQFQALLNAMPKKVEDAMKAVVEKTADDTVKRLKIVAPVHPDAPHLRDTIRKEKGKDDLTYEVKVGSSTLIYAPFVEFGHRKHGKHVPAQPFFFPTIKIMRRRFRQRLIRAIRKALK